MSIPNVVSPSTSPTGVEFQQSAGGSIVCIDFRSVAGLIDAVAGYDPVRLSTLFTMIWETSFKMETRAVLQVAVACRDPLSDLGTICKDALQTFADLEKLTLKRHWKSITAVLGNQNPHACALLNACDHQISRLQDQKQTRYLTIRSRLEAAALHERTARSTEIQTYTSLRQARCPHIWEVYEFWHDKK